MFGIPADMFYPALIGLIIGLVVAGAVYVDPSQGFRNWQVRAKEACAGLLLAFVLTALFVWLVLRGAFSNYNG